MSGQFNEFTKLWSRLGTGLKASYLKSLFFWNPVFSLGFCLWFGLGDGFLRQWATSFFISTIVSNVCFGTVILISRLEPVIARLRNRPKPVHSVAWHFSLSVCAMPGGLYLALLITGRIYRSLGLPWHTDAGDYKVSILIGTLIAGVFFLSKTRTDARITAKETALRMKQLENDRLQAQVSALTAQMNPHLLFNALNTVASLVPTDPKKAEEIILRLSELYRGVLDSSRRVTHSLTTELDICRAYLAVEHARFGSRLEAFIELHSNINADSYQVPVLTIQPLVENAVKHGLSTRTRGGKIRIHVYLEQNHLKVQIEDDGVGIGNSTNAGAGTGIMNCRDRIKLTYGEAGKLELLPRQEGGTLALMSLPILLCSTIPVPAR
jgi:two-component sensor histidine kinase